MKGLEKLIGLEKGYKVVKIGEKKDNNKIIQEIYVESIKNKVRCAECGRFTTSVHDRLKPIKLKSLKIYEKDTTIIVIKRRFICHKCNKRFTEPSELNMKNASISNKLKQKILKDLREYNLSLKYIAKNNNVSEFTVRNTLLEAMSDYPSK